MTRVVSLTWRVDQNGKARESCEIVDPEQLSDDDGEKTGRTERYDQRELKISGD